ncbi:nucleotide exchange factor GrpE [Emcibacter nanhaiensis]|uniref:Protein GrpE n=1 Tax=Emcibacter nanhaiensis TaxID=1505037 RepID=A0A501PHA6_9PROT|nr:nucleotide exchange factor GrpE [Emcibacter nanhaiensis]TPD59799.1 nucleotide exchange factor GrpE [Emcibacter nanhaiensis]
MTENTEHTQEKPEEQAADAEGAPAEQTAEQSADDALAAAMAEIADLKDKLLRAVAETENLRRRAEKERQDASNYAVTAFARDLLPVSDNLRRALDSLPEDADGNETLKALVEGVEMTERELLNNFEKHGIRMVDPKGEKFDHNLHQAMFEVPNSGEADGTVVQVMQVGYTLKDRLLRPAMVGVAKGGSGEKTEHVDTTA